MRHACHKPRDQGARGRQGEEGVGEVPRVLLRDVYAGRVKRGRGQGDRGPGTQGPGKGGKGGRGRTNTRGAEAGPGSGSRGGQEGGRVASRIAPHRASAGPGGGGKEEEAGEKREGGGEEGGRRPSNQGRGAGQGERGRANRGQDRARGPGQREGQRGSAASRIAPHCARAGRRAEGPRSRGREGGNMVPHNRASRPQRAGAPGKAGCRGVLPQGSPPPKVQCGVCLRSVMQRGPAGTREGGTGRAKEVGHKGGKRRQDSQSRERERRGRQGHAQRRESTEGEGGSRGGRVGDSAVRVQKPNVISFMRVSCHVNQAWSRRQEVARGDGHLRRHPWGLPCGDPTCGAEGTRARGAIH